MTAFAAPPATGECLTGGAKREERRMSADYDLPTAVRAALVGAGAVTEIKMFGGIGFMLNGNMVAGASKRGLLLRVGKDGQSALLAQPGTRPMEMRGRTMEGYAYIDPPALNSQSVPAGIKLALAYVKTLPPKAAGGKSGPAKGKRK
jgi:TfoX/Sxy family transcriptional regulator of competence genes